MRFVQPTRVWIVEVRPKSLSRSESIDRGLAMRVVLADPFPNSARDRAVEAYKQTHRTGETSGARTPAALRLKLRASVIGEGFVPATMPITIPADPVPVRVMNDLLVCSRSDKP